MAKKLFYLLIFFFLISGILYGQNTSNKLFCFNTFDHLLKGNTWVYVTLNDIERELSKFPGNWGCVLLGKSLQEMKSGEIIGWGTVASHNFFWVSPEYPFSSNLLLKQNQKINLALLAVFDPFGVKRFQIKNSNNLKKAIIGEMQNLKLQNAIIEVQGVIKNVDYSIAYNLPHEGVNLDYPEKYFNFLNHQPPSYWHLVGFYTKEPSLQKLISIDEELTLAGFSLKNRVSENEKNLRKGGQIIQAEVEEVEVSVYPLEEYKAYHANLKISEAKIENNQIIFKVTNNSPLWLDHVSVEGIDNLRKKFEFRLESFSPFSSQQVIFDFKADKNISAILLRVNNNRDIFEENYQDNQLVLGDFKPKVDDNLIIYCREDALWQMSPEGRNMKKIQAVEEDKHKVFCNPSWSKDRLKIAYYVFDKWRDPVQKLLITPQPTIFIADLTTRKNYAVFKPEEPGTIVDDLCFSADDDYLYFTLSRADFGEAIARVNLENFRTERIIEGGFSPDLSYDGRLLVFVAYNKGYKNLVLSNPEGKNQKIILSFGDFVDLANPKFSPDGSKIIFSGVSADKENQVFELWLYDLKNETIQKVLDQKSSEPFKVCWSPQADRIIYSTEKKIFSYDFKEGSPKFIATGEMPTWY